MVPTGHMRPRSGGSQGVIVPKFAQEPVCVVDLAYVVDPGSGGTTSEITRPAALARVDDSPGLQEHVQRLIDTVTSACDRPEKPQTGKCAQEAATSRGLVTASGS